MRRWSWLVLGVAACAGSPPAKRASTDWELVLEDVDLVVDDPSADSIYARANGHAVAFGAKPATGERAPAVPILQDVPPRARAFVTAARGLRWRADDGPWHGWDPGPARPEDARPSPLSLDLPPVSVVGGVLVELPFAGPDHGVPRPLALFGTKDADGPSDVVDPPAPDALPAGDVVAAARDVNAIVASAGGLVLFDLTTDTSRAFKRGAPVVPALSSNGLLGAAAMGVGPVPGAAGAPKVESELVGLFEGSRPLAALPLRERPLSLHFAGDALYAEMPDGRLLRHVLDTPARARRSHAEEQALKDRDGRLVAMREALDAKDLARAVDALDDSYRRGYMDLPTKDQVELAKEVREAAHPSFLKAVQQAVAQEDFEWALVLHRRLQLLDGSTTSADTLRMPVLDLAVTAQDGAGFSDAAIDAYFTAHENFERVERCLSRAERAPTSVCLEVHFPAPSSTPNVTALREAAKHALEDDEAPPDAFARALFVYRGRTGNLHTNDGGLGFFVYPNAGDEKTRLADAMERALAAELALEARQTDGGARTRRLRLLLWMRDPFDALATVARGDATER